MLTEGLILPISVAMKQHEEEYLSALQSVSKSIRDLWDVTILDEISLDAIYLGSGDPYRYWDATHAIEFGLKMAHHALDHSLIGETEYLKDFDLVRSRINARYDLLDKDLHALIRMAYSNQGTLSQHRRKQYALTVQPEAMDAIEEEVKDRFFSGNVD